MQELEKEVEAYLVHAIETLGGYCLKFVSPGHAGVPDRVCLLPYGLVVFVELKKPEGGVLAKRQAIWGRRLRAKGLWVELVSTKDECRALAGKIAELVKELSNERL